MICAVEFFVNRLVLIENPIKIMGYSDWSVAYFVGVDWLTVKLGCIRLVKVVLLGFSVAVKKGERCVCILEY